MSTESEKDTVLDSSTEDNARSSDERINQLMSKWHKSQSEVDKLKAENEELRSAAAEAFQLAKGADDQVKTKESEYAAKLSELEATFKAKSEELQAKDSEISQLRQIAARDSFLLKNPDLLDYVSILPKTGTPEDLEAAAEIIRKARDKEKPTSPMSRASGHQAPQLPAKELTATEVKDYVDSASNPAERSKRIEELRKRFGG